MPYMTVIWFLDFSYAIPAYCGCVKLGAVFQAELSQ